MSRNWTISDLEALANRRKNKDDELKAKNREALRRGPLRSNSVSNACRIGIDPAFRKGGFCVCVIDEDSTARFTTFSGLVAFVKWLYWEAPDQAIVTVENSNLQNKTFDMSGSKAEVARKSRNVGCNQAISQEVVNFCIDKYGEENVNNISPKEKGAKLTDVQFKSIATMKRHKLARYTGSQDQRDAYKLAIFGI